MEKEKKKDFVEDHHFEVEYHEKGKVILKAELLEKALNMYKIAHGGFLFGLGDTAMGYAAFTYHEKVETISATISYLKAAKGEYVKAEGRVVKSGKNIVFTEASIYNDKEELIATMTGNYYVLD